MPFNLPKTGIRKTYDAGVKNMKKIKYIIIVVLIVLAVIVILQNTQSVETKLLFITITMPRALLLMVTFLAGLATGIFVSGIWTKRTEQSKK